MGRVYNHPCPLCDIAPLEDSDGTLAVKPLQGAGASTGDRLGGVTSPICGLGH